jgi:ribosomal protein S18 acetylase RimI-like enzyme
MPCKSKGVIRLNFRKAVEPDISSIMNIIKQAQDYFKKQGIDQWQNNYPNLETILNDIKNKNGYVLLDDDTIIGTVSVSFDGEKTYRHIYNGKWITNGNYAVVHRLAVDQEFKRRGLATIIMKKTEEICLNRDIHSIRIDTHEENLAMQKLLNKNKFEYCGIIYLEGGSKRIAFEKIL